MSIYKYDSTQDKLIPLAGGVLYADAPVGAIFAYGGSNPVDGFLLCNGQAVSRTTYAELFSVIGTSFGSGDGSTTFNVPDLREATTKGIGENPNGASHVKTGGLALGEFIDDRVQNITGKLSRSGIIGAGGAFYGSGSNYNANLLSGSIDDSKYDIYFDASRIVRAGNTTEVKSVGVNYIIKATQVGAPADFMDAVDEAVEEALAVIDSPITKVGTAINGNRFWSKRTGNVVEIMIDGTTGSNIPCGQSVVVAKVPKNALIISDICIEIDSKSLVSASELGHKRAWVDSTGNVCIFIVMPDLAATYTGNIYIGGTYITAE